MATPRWDEKNQKWILSVMVDRKRKEFTSTAPGRSGLAEVRKKYQKWLMGEADKSQWRIEKCWPEFLKDIQARSGRENYVLNEKYGRLHILPKVRMRRVGSLATQDWQEIINNAHGEKVHNLSKKTLSNLRGAIMNFCTFAERSGMMNNPPKNLYVPKQAKTIGKSILQPDQIIILFQPSEEWYINAWRIMLLTGLRPGEVYGIQKADIVNGILTIRRAIDSKGFETTGKNANARREIPLPSLAQSIIAEQIAILMSHDICSPWVFADKHGDAPCPHTAYHHWQTFAKQHNIECPPYSMRHTFVSLVKNVMPAEMVKSIVGHSESMDTFGVYGKKVSGEMQQSKKIMDGVFKKWIK